MNNYRKAKQALKEAVEEITGGVILSTDITLSDTDKYIEGIDFIKILMLVEEKLSIEEIDIAEHELTTQTPIEEIIRIIESKL